MKPKQAPIFCLISLITAMVLPVQAEPALASCELPDEFDLQGHRGARGLFPENTIPGFLYALDLGVTTLEMDVVVNTEGTVLLSHEPWISATICRHPDGRFITEKESKNLNIYHMDDEEVRAYDCGSRGHSGFPDQQPIKQSKPSLDEVFEAVRLRSIETGRDPVLFNIEIKSSPEHDDVYHPDVEHYALSLYKVLQQHDVINRTSIQSFDPRALEAAHDIDPDVSLVLLVENAKSFHQNLARLSFKPAIYSPYYKRVDKDTIEAAREQQIRVIPWTVNDEKAMKKLLELGVDGLITDYPALGLAALCGDKKDP
jgi:glycerophosphoryl diester phosphodiesterase